MIEHALAQALAYLPTILLAALVFLAGIGLVPLARRLVERRLRALPQETRRFLGRLIHVAVVVLGVLLALTALGVYGMAIATLVGAMGLAISLALQDVARNLVAGFYLRLEHPFGPGDRIILKGETGEIAFVGLRTTLLRRAHFALLPLDKSSNL